MYLSYAFAGAADEVAVVAIEPYESIFSRAPPSIQLPQSCWSIQLCRSPTTPLISPNVGLDSGDNGGANPYARDVVVYVA